MFRKKRILIILDYYLPSFKAGGPVKSISNLVEQLEDYDFFIVTRDHDLGSDITFNNVLINNWNKVGNANVYYMTKSSWTISGVNKIIMNTKHEILYLNSFFSFWTSILPIFLLFFQKKYVSKIIIAPRGEFSPGALNLKKNKKKFFIFFAKKIKIYKNILWQATSEIESEHIKNIFTSARVKISPNLLSKKFNTPISFKNVDNYNGSIRILFLSRITPKKNLEFLLKCLNQINQNIILNIYGTIEDKEYWNNCLELIKSAPQNINIKYWGEANPKEVQEIFSKNDVFIFPTFGENFGHVIFESLSNATPIVISDQTPWKSCQSNSVVILPLIKEKWIKEITKWSNLSRSELLERRKFALIYINNYLKTNKSVSSHKDLFNQMFIIE